MVEIHTMQDIPQQFKGKAISGAEAVRQALELARKANVIPTKSPLRTIWYAFIKLSLQNITKPLKNPADIFYREFAKYIRTSGLYYADFNIENSGVVYETHPSRGFGNTVLCLEKESYFGVFKNLSQLLGISVYAAGGQPSQSGTEYVFRQLPDTTNLYLPVISDFDPAGLDIANTLKEQFTMYSRRLKRYHLTFHVTLERIATLPQYYTTEELANALYQVKDVKRRRWNLAEIEAIRKQYAIPREQGLEVESLPADPEPIFLKLFPKHRLGSWEGQARVRLLVLKALIKQFGIRGYLEDYLRNSFSNDLTAEELVDTKSGKTGVDQQVDAIRELLREIQAYLAGLLESEVQRVERELNWWALEEIAHKVADEDYQQEFLQVVIDKVMWDSPWLGTEDFEVPEAIKRKIRVSPEITEKVQRVYDRLETMKTELEQLRDELQEEESY